MMFCEEQRLGLLQPLLSAKFFSTFFTNSFEMNTSC